MLEDGALLEGEISALDFNALLAFWTSEVGRTILGQKASIQREIPFTARFSPEDFAQLNLCPQAADLRGEYFAVRGKADLAVLLPKEIWLLDFKTGQLAEDEFDQKVQLYTPQLRLYALGLGRIYRRPVTRCWLHFLGPGKTVTV
jgi:ATP-dependent helicase/nuclease subunit A